MGAAADNPTDGSIPGITVEVEDLVRVQAQLSGISLNDLRRRSSFRSGARETRHRGRGMEYEESRAYVAGDDVRTMDWRVMARMGEAHTKVFAEEKQRSFLLAVDLSASMDFGTRYAFKSCAAAYVAATIGWLATMAGDRLGGLIVTPLSHQEVRPGKNRSGLMGVFHHLAEQTRLPLPFENSDNRINFLLRELMRVVKPGSNVALISDFLGIDQQSSELLSGLARHNDISAFWVHDRTEVEHWPTGRYQLLTKNEKVSIDIPRSSDGSWLKARQDEHNARIESLSAGFGIPLLPLSCNSNVTAQIVNSLGSL